LGSSEALTIPARDDVQTSRFTIKESVAIKLLAAL
jgi:hypothetical protein